MLKRFEVAHPSMTPALTPGDYILAKKTRRTPRRGEVIVFDQPNSGFVIKRIVALGGETIHASGGTVFVNNDPTIDSWGVGLTTPFDSQVVPEGTVWVLGDRRELSTNDSRTIGPIDCTVRWQAILRYFPIGSIGKVN